MPKIEIKPQKISQAKRFYEILINPNFKYFIAAPKSVEAERKWLRENTKNCKENCAWNYAIFYNGKLVGGMGVKINKHKKLCWGGRIFCR